MGRKIIFMILLGIVMISCDTRSHYFYSPDKKKCITFIRDKEDANLYFVIPGKIDGSRIPDNNYLLIKWSEVHNFDVNWSSKKYRFAYPMVVKNTLDTSQVDFSFSLRKEELVQINGESWYKLPEVEGFALPYLFRGSYVEKRREMYDAYRKSQ